MTLPAFVICTYALFTVTPKKEDEGLFQLFMLGMMAFTIIAPTLSFLRHRQHKRNKANTLANHLK